jgi:hypothetical protein
MHYKYINIIYNLLKGFRIGCMYTFGILLLIYTTPINNINWILYFLGVCGWIFLVRENIDDDDT